jgi:glycosyltransferase involved in cell wall biosynthesis
VARALHDRFAFVVVPTERLHTARGSLAHQLLPWTEAIFELGELAPQSAFLSLVESLAASYRPRLVWICNGSPWLLAHAAALRRIFADVPIVDQQVYDTEVGWIEHYADDGIQSFDRFVAINRQIERVFRERIGIAPERIDLVYHALDAERFHLAGADACPRPEVARAHGLPSDRPCVGMVGRLVEQKRPLDFLELARRARDAGDRACFVLVGDGELASACDAFASRHGLDNLRRIPFVEDMSRLLPIFEGLVICSAYEGLPISMLEALAMGVPVLSTPVGDVPLVLEEYGVGRVVPRGGDPQALWSAYRSWRQELPRLRERAREAAPRLAARFSAAAAAAAYEASWRRALADRSRAVGARAHG